MDRFKLELAHMKKNVSWLKKQPRIEEIEHVHHFYTFDENGRAQAHSTPVGGHFHKIEWHVDDQGDFVAKCGPALRYVYRKLANGTMKKFVEPVQYMAQRETEDSVQEYMIKDDHTHNVAYHASEFFSAKHKKEIQQNNAAHVGQPPARPQSTAATGQMPAGFSLEGSKVD